MEEKPNEKVVGRLKINSNRSVVVKLSSYKGEQGLDIRTFVHTDKYEGYSKKGIRIPLEHWPMFKEIMKNVDPNILVQ